MLAGASSKWTHVSGKHCHWAGDIGNGMSNTICGLCYRRVKSKLKILLITSRDTGRWVLPKGWPMDGCTSAETVIEAWEEAAPRHSGDPGCEGIYSYDKELDTGVMLPVIVAVFGVKTTRSQPHSMKPQSAAANGHPKEAARLVDEPDLSLLQQFKR